MSLFKNLIGVAYLCLGIAFVGLSACSSNDDSYGSNGDELDTKLDTVKVIDPETGDTIIRVDSSYRHIDSVRTIDPATGDTIIKIDTIFIPVDSTIHWKGNSALVITEISPGNLNWLDQDGDDPGWVEIYNAGTEAANLKGYALIENLSKGRKWIFGDELIAAKSFRIVFCDNKNLTTVEGGSDADNKHFRTHTNWKLEHEGGSIYLIDPYFAIRDSVRYPKLSGGLSWGIVDGGDWKYFSKPTPEQRNDASTAYDGFAPAFTFSGSQGGFYSDEVKLNPPSTSDGLKVRCTQDGSMPNENSPEFNETLTISENTTLRCAAYKQGLLTVDVVTNTYFISEEVNMPVVAISVDPVFFQKHYVKKSECGSSDPKTCPAGLMEDVEYPIHVEYYAEGSKSKQKAWEIEAGISLMGGWSRVNDKKSVSIVMREEYQDGWLHYPLFETRSKGEKDKYKAFNLRNNGNRFVSDYIEDAMAGALLEGSGVDYQRSRQVVVFYNGKYYGIHDMRERYNRAYVESNYGIDNKTVQMVKQLGGDSSITASGDDATAVANYRQMLHFIGENDMTNADNYATAKTYLDMGNLADYMAAEIYYHNGDWPNNNVRAWSAPGQPWKFMVYDVDHGFDWLWGVNGGEFGQSTNMFTWIKKGGGNKSCSKVGCFANIYLSLIKNENFKRMFLNHSAVMWQKYLNAERVSQVVDAMMATINSSDMERDLNRFERYYDKPFDEDGSGLKSWASSRDESVVKDYKSEFGVGDLVAVSISSSGKGAVLVDEMNLPGNTASSTNYKGKFFNGVQMELTAVPAAGAVFEKWSDGTNENPHLVTVKSDLSISAIFK